MTEAASRYAIERLGDRDHPGLVHDRWFYVCDTTRHGAQRRVSSYFRTRAQAERCRDILIADDAKGACRMPECPGFYIAVIHKDPHSFGISFPDFPGCITAGRTLQEATDMATEALHGHIAEMQAAGEPIPKPVSWLSKPKPRDGVGYWHVPAVPIPMTVPTPETPAEAERRQLRTGARQLLLLAERCPALFEHVLAPIPDDVLETLHELAFDDEDTDNAAN